jgi:hypothetical protein
MTRDGPNPFKKLESNVKSHGGSSIAEMSLPGSNETAGNRCERHRTVRARPASDPLGVDRAKLVPHRALSDSIVTAAILKSSSSARAGNSSSNGLRSQP